MDNTEFKFNNISIFKMGEIYSFNFSEMKNRSLKILIENIDDILLEFDKKFIYIDEVIDAKLIKDYYSFKIELNIKPITTCNGFIKNLKIYTIKADSILFNNLDNIIIYIRKLLLSIKKELTELYLNDKDIQLDEFEDIL